MTWARLRRSIAPSAAALLTVAGIIQLNSRMHLPLGSYQLNAMLAVNLFAEVILAGAAAAVSAWDASIVRRRPTLTLFEAAGSRPAWLVLLNRLMPTAVWMSLALTGLMIGALLAAPDGQWRWRNLWVAVLAWCVLMAAIAWGGLLGTRLPIVIGPLVAVLTVYACYYVSILTVTSSASARIPYLDGAWAPIFTPSPQRLGGAVGLVAATAVTTFLLTSTPTKLIPVSAASTVALCCATALLLQPVDPAMPFYSELDRDPSCHTTPGRDVCVLGEDLALLPALTSGRDRALTVLSEVGRDRLNVTEAGPRPAAPDQMVVEPTTLRDGPDAIATALLLQSSATPRTCPAAPTSDTDGGVLWSDIVGAALLDRAALPVLPHQSFPTLSALDRLPRAETQRWLAGALDALARCRATAPAPPR